jgi:outer membrane protein
MKNISFIISAVLAVALGVLFIFFFSLRKQVKELETQPNVASTAGARIVYINMDTVYTKYDRYTDLKAQLEEKQRRMEAEMASKKSTYEKSVGSYQDKMQKGLLLRSEAAKIEQQLAGDQQSLMKLSESFQSQLAEESQVMNRQLLNSIVEYLKEYNKNGKYQFIMSHAYGGNLLYANDSLDITKEVLKGLNEKYNSEKNKK